MEQVWSCGGGFGYNRFDLQQTNVIAYSKQCKKMVTTKGGNTTNLLIVIGLGLVY